MMNINMLQELYLTEKEKNEGVLMFHVEEEQSYVYYYKNSTLMYLRLLSGEYALIEELARNLSLDMDSAYKLWKRFGDVDPNLVTPVVIVGLPDGRELDSPLLSSCVADKYGSFLERVVLELAPTGILHELKSVVLVGSICEMPHIRDFFSKYFTVPVRLGVVSAKY